MTAIPATFRAFVATRGRGRNSVVTRGVRTFAEADLPPGEVEIRVGWSSVNFKDGLATIANGKVARISPLIPGIDLAGEVHRERGPGDPGRACRSSPTATTLGVSRHGGYAEYQRVPAGWVVPLPAGLTPRLAMAVGTAGFTAALSVVRLEERGLRPGARPGARDRRVAAASGRTAVGILAGRGYEVLGGDRARPTRRTACAGSAPPGSWRARRSPPRAPDRSSRSAGRARSTASAGRRCRTSCARSAAAATVAASGNTGGPGFATTVFPFILRSVALVGIDSAQVPDRRAPRRLGADRERPAPERPRRRAHRGHARHAPRARSTASSPGSARGRWIVRDRRLTARLRLPRAGRACASATRAQATRSASRTTLKVRQ